MSSPRHRLAKALEEGRFITAPGIYDGLSARLADGCGFSALYLTGYGVSASLLGKPDAGFLERGHMTDRVRTICAVVDTPLIADADTGFGGPVDVAATVRAYEAAGAAAIQLEDQVFPKRCGHTPGRDVIDLDEALDKLKAALDARIDPDFMIVARTDARTGHGLNAAIDRAGAFAETGADILFVESPQSERELAGVVRALPDARLLANMVEGGHTPFLPPARLEAMGFGLAIYPVHALATAASALRYAYGDLLDGGLDQTPRMSFAELNRATGFEALWQDDANERDT